MAASETRSGMDVANPRKPANTRRPVGSNIGVRRQRPVSRNVAGTIQQLFSQLNDESDFQKSALRIEDSSSRYRRYPLHQPVQSRHWTLDRSESSTTDSGPVTSRGDSPSDESDSPPTILTNPDIDILPVESTPQARTSFDFYVNSYVTSIIEVAPQNANAYTHVVHQILHDELLFTAFTTVSEAARWRTQSLYGDPPLSIAKGYGKTIALLSERLRSEKFAMSPSVLLTMGQLVAIETMIKNVSATARHLAGMQSAMTARTGSKPSQGSAPVQTAVDVWTQFFIQRAIVKASVNRYAILTYPRHPFDPNLSNRIAELPLGFADVALSGRISIEMLDLLDRFNVYFTKMNQIITDGITDSSERTQIVLLQAAYCIEYAQMRALTLIERLLLAALTAYVVRRDRVHPGLVNIRNYYQITCAYLANILNSTSLDPKDQGSNIMIWIGLTLLLTSTPEAYARKLALRLLPRRPEPLKLLKQCQDFFWDADLTNALLSGSVLITSASNDIIADNVKQALPESDD